MQPHPQGCDELIGIHGFREIIRRAGLEALFPVALHGLGRQGDDRQPSQIWPRPNGLDDLINVGAIANADIDLELADGAVIMQNLADNLSIGNDHARLVRVEESGGEQFHILDDALHADQFDVLG